MQFSSEPTMIGGGPADAGRTQVVAAAPDKTQMGASVECPVCRSRNLSTEVYCSECGFLLESTPETTEQASAPEAPVAVLTDTRTNQRYPLQPGKYSVGRENTDILLTDPGVSRSHATLTVLPSSLEVMDLGSTNGTVVAGKRLEANTPERVRSGQDIRFGNSVLTVEMEAEEEPVVPEGAPEEAQAAPEEAQEAQAEAEQTSEATEEQTSVQSDDEQEGAAVEPELLDEPAGGDRVEEFTLDLPETDTQPEPAEAACPLEASSSVLEGAYFQAKDDPQKVYPVSQEGANIGRRANNDIVLSDPHVSSSHAQVVVQNDTYILVDTGSTNGTAVNGKKIEANDPVVLSAGDKVSFGPVALVFKVGEPG